MAWLFGKKSTEEKKQKVDPEHVLAGISNQIVNMDLRHQLLEKRVKALTTEALKMKQAKNTRAAILALKKKKLVDQEMIKIEGMKMLMEQQKMQLEGTTMHNL